MVTRGVYRTTNPESGAQSVFVDHGCASAMGEVPKPYYEERGYNPPFESLPTKEQFEMSQLQEALAVIFELAEQGMTTDGLPEEAVALFEKIASIAHYEADVVGVRQSEDTGK